MTKSVTNPPGTGIRSVNDAIQWIPTELTSQLGAPSWLVSSVYDLHIFSTVKTYCVIHRELPVGLLAQLVERCTGIAKVMGSNPVQA